MDSEQDKQRNLGGRPTKKQITAQRISQAVTKLNDDTVKKLEEVFALDGTVEEACFYAGITRATYYNWIKDNKDLFDRFESLRQRPFLKARKTIVDSLALPEYAFKYMTKKKREEFGDSIDVTSKNEKLSTTEEVINKAKKFDEWYKQNTKRD